MNSKYPIVTIVGRRNVGKSTLFNALIKQKKAIVDDMPGLTRDVITFNYTHNDAVFTISDTPGLDLPADHELSSQIRENSKKYLEKSSVIVFLMENPTPDTFDLELASILRKLNLPTIIAVNKMDNDKEMENMSNFYEMGFTDILPISALRKSNISMMLDKIVDLLPVKKTAIHEADLKISIVGKPNSGKSTLLNAIIGYDRSIVSDIPGTTRDAVDEEFQYHGKTIKLIDTAGIRKKTRIKEDVEYYSLRRTLDTIKKCDVAVHLIDAVEGFSEFDKKISDELVKERKPVIIAINKWDAVEKDHKTFEEFKDRLFFKFYRAEDFPVISISAKNRQRIDRLIKTAVELKEKSIRRIETPKLNRMMEEIQSSSRIPQLRGKIRIYYATQIGTEPPLFKFFVNNTDNFRSDTMRYFEKAMQKELDLEGIPIIIKLEGKKKRN